MDIFENKCISSSFKNKKVLLVGGTGFIGRHILLRLLAYGADVTVLALFLPGEYDGDILNECKILKGDVTQHANRKVISETNWNIVINVGGFINQRYDAKSENEIFTGHLLHVRELVSLLPTTIERFVHAGSAVEYGANLIPHREEFRENPLNPYAAAKVATTHYLQMLYRSKSFPSVILRPFFVFGPGQDKGKFLPWTIEQAMFNSEIKITKGEQTRDPIHVKDVAEAFIRASIEKKALGEVINVASGFPVAILDIINKISNIVGKKCHFLVGALPYRQGEIMKSQADVTKLKNILGIVPTSSIDDGIKEIMERDFIL